MKILFLFATSLFFPIMFPAHANNQTIDMNMSSPSVKVIKRYSGKWKGWDDGCINCDKPLTSDRVHLKPIKHKISKNKVKKTKIENMQLLKSVKRGYCECNCKPMIDKGSLNNGTTHRVFGAKDNRAPTSSGAGTTTKTQKHNDEPSKKKLEMPDTEKGDSTDKKKENSNTQSRMNEKIINIFSLWKS